MEEGENAPIPALNARTATVAAREKVMVTTSILYLQVVSVVKQNAYAVADDDPNCNNTN